LPDREGKTLEAWLKAHAGIQTLTRDRSGVYAAAMTAACPQAVQVADRWHLLKNLSENLERLLDSQRTLINQAALEVNQSLTAASELPANDQPSMSPVLTQPTPGVTADQVPIGQAIPTEKRYHHYQQVKALQQVGHPMRAIARHLGMSRRTVKKYFTQESFVPKTKTKRANLLEFELYLRQRWQAGETNGKTLLKQIKQLGYKGSYTILMNLLASYPKTASESALPAAQKGLTYSSRSLSIAFCQAESEWEQEKRPLLNKLLEKSPLLQQARELSLAFKTLMTQKKGQELENWCQQASQLPAFTGFVRGIRQDFAAVQQAMTSAWSNGQTEGLVNRLKNIKRQMYGRASFDLLRLRVLARAV
jgi:transposase